MLQSLDGKKTYIGVALSFVLGALIALGQLPADSQAVQLIVLAILTFTGVSYRAAIGKTK